jgi:hypothetical protein
MNFRKTAMIALAISSSPVLAAEPAGEAMLVNNQAVEPDLVLPANSEVNLSFNDEITTKGNHYHQGDTFSLTVMQTVFKDGYVVIPQGSRATGRITFLTSKGAFGKSGKMDVAIEYVQANGRRIPLQGTYRQEGEGNTVATVGGVIAVGLVAGFLITGKSATIPQGRELVARTKADVPIRVAAARQPRVEALAESAPLPRPYQAEQPEVRSSVQPTAQPARANWGLVAATPK